MEFVARVRTSTGYVIVLVHCSRCLTACRVRRYSESEARYVKGLLKEGGEEHLRHAALLLQRWLAAGEFKKGSSDTFYHLLAVRVPLITTLDVMVGWDPQDS